ncbi:MAG: ABC transporter ATP-binding protein [Paludibacter sp. 47-17]|nr:MAG: ABC transporter [Paludibacter sp. SCN 50-10]OJX90624.1 MAG: ABC transporter ATP-binding protein [Paludibacter sp. 47-17]
MPTSIKFENISKQYRLGLVSTRTLSHDLNRWFQMNIRGKDDPYLKIGETNDRAHRGQSDYVWALKDINFEVEQGDVLGIIGKNGAGKSTLLKILSKVTSPSTGTIRARGRIASLLEVGTGFHPEMTGRDNIYMNGAIMGMSKAEITRKLDEIVDFSGVERYLDTPVKRYSSGMTVRLGFAIAAHLDPEILVVDEVLAVGDAEFQKKAIGKMQDVSKGEGRTVLFVSHNMGSIKTLCNKGLVLKDGQVSYSGDIHDSIAYYLMSMKSVLAIPLDQRKDRRGNQLIKATNIELKTLTDIPLSSVASGQGFKICLSYEKLTNEVYKNVTVSFSMADDNDMPLFLIHNRLTGDKIDVSANSGVFECIVTKFALNAGTYLLSYTISADNGRGDTFDLLSNACEIKVESGNFYKTGETAPDFFGPMLLDGYFRIQHD